MFAMIDENEREIEGPVVDSRKALRPFVMRLNDCPQENLWADPRRNIMPKLERNVIVIDQKCFAGSRARVSQLNLPFL